METRNLILICSFALIVFSCGLRYYKPVGNGEITSTWQEDDTIHIESYGLSVTILGHYRGRSKFASAVSNNTNETVILYSQNVQLFTNIGTLHLSDWNRSKPFIESNATTISSNASGFKRVESVSIRAKQTKTINFNFPIVSNDDRHYDIKHVSLRLIFVQEETKSKIPIEIQFVPHE